MTLTDATYTPPNLGDLSAAPARYHRCGPGGSETFVLNPELVTTVTTPGSVATSQIKDAIFETESSAATRSDYAINVESLLPLNLQPKSVTVTSSNTSILANPVNGVAQGVAAGAADLIARASDGEVCARRVTVAIAGSGSSVRWTGFSSGSLAAHCTDEIENRILGLGRSSMPLWSAINNTSGEYQWNPACWGADISNLTCMSPWNSSTGSGGGGALITPRHLLHCHHVGFYPKVGATIRYVRPDNTTESFTITDVLAHPCTSGYVISLHDIVICKLDRDVPGDISFAKVLPANPHGYLPSIKTDRGQPGTTAGNWNIPYVRSCYTTQSKRLATGFTYVLPNAATACIPVGTPAGDSESRMFVRVDLGPDYSFLDFPSNPLGDNITVGDSGCPAFLVVNGELVLTNVWTSVGSGYGFYADATIVNGMLDTLGGGYQLTEVDLSGFPTY